tara:strand:- start:7878 stop:8084 length:207 start_codon:yes stop_codon:yes gene_type:complete
MGLYSGTLYLSKLPQGAKKTKEAVAFLKPVNPASQLSRNSQTQAFLPKSSSHLNTKSAKPCPNSNLFF